MRKFNITHTWLRCAQQQSGAENQAWSLWALKSTSENHKKGKKSNFKASETISLLELLNRSFCDIFNKLLKFNPPSRHALIMSSARKTLFHLWFTIYDISHKEIIFAIFHAIYSLKDAFIMTNSNTERCRSIDSSNGREKDKASEKNSNLLQIIMKLSLKSFEKAFCLWSKNCLN